MATVRTLQTASTTPTLIQVGPGALWFGVTKPGDTEILQVSGSASGSQDQRIYGPRPFTLSGTFAGSTIGESTFSYKASFVDIHIETSTAKVEKVLNTEEARCNFSMAEMSAENIQRAMPGDPNNGPVATLSTQTDPYSSIQTVHVLKVGGLRLTSPQCIAFISANRRINLTADGPFSYVFCGYNAVSTEGFETPFSRGRESLWRVSFEMISDTARTLGDQLYQLCVRQVG